LEVGIIHSDENKTKDPRAWTLSSDLVEALKRWKQLLGKVATPHRVVLLDARGTTVDAFEAARMLCDGLKTAGVDRHQLFESNEHRIALRAHDLRASFVTVNLSLEKTEAWITDRTGHKSSAMIYRYKRAARNHARLEPGRFRPAA
jgi:hypothetical protein